MNIFQKAFLVVCLIFVVWFTVTTLPLYEYSEQGCFYFCKGGLAIELNDMALQVRENPATKNIKIQEGCVKPSSMKKSKFRGKLNIHRWIDGCPCGYSMDRAMRIHSKFPGEPEIESTTNSSEVKLNGETCSQRIFGYVTPEKTGHYRFAVSSDLNSELWISRDSSPQNVELVAYVGDPIQSIASWTNLRDFHRNKSQISKPINLTAGQDYYLEALHRSQAYLGHITIAWQQPGIKETNFILIDSKLLSLYLPENTKLQTLLKSHSNHVRCILEDHLPLALKVMPPITARQLKDEREDMCLKYPTLNHSQVQGVLKTCPYNPTYKPNRKVKEFEGFYHNLVKKTGVYPDDKTSLFSSGNDIVTKSVKKTGVYPDDKTSLFSSGNDIVTKSEVEEIAKEYMDRLQKVKGDLYSLKKILNVELKTDSAKGNRYLLELELGVKESNESVRLSEYVYKFKKKYAEAHNDTTTDLCYPEEMVWRSDKKIYIILPVQNYGFWVKYFIDELIKISLKTKEENFHLVVIDFNSTDFKTKEYLQNSILRNRFTFIEKDSKFIKTTALNQGVATVKDPGSIIFLMDLHITIPPCFFDIIRKHVIKGKLCFFPILLRLSCSFSENYPHGYWEDMGYGLLGIYKQDWDSFGGENEKKFKFKWGGEDWDLLDRVLNAKIEAERFKWQKLFHFPHSKRGAWTRHHLKP